MIGFRSFSKKNAGSFLSIANQCLNQIIEIIIISVKNENTIKLEAAVLIFADNF
jgi:hypothetical protein